LLASKELVRNLSPKTPQGYEKRKAISTKGGARVMARGDLTEQLDWGTLAEMVSLRIKGERGWKETEEILVGEVEERRAEKRVVSSSAPGNYAVGGRVRSKGQSYIDLSRWTS